ncbi:ankyrin repeat-containing domain protein [Sphaerosporella brunnea]|uniref:Ankyrin repeat-containing domain protein n=1 Tax=Sphaerosporella brunnea TaxID=1250544 RepID=A0A5J5F949_9PEZI|nr:ankyrin repeat-containing domain protein [Sphaerosporella brunnea]
MSSINTLPTELLLELSEILPLASMRSLRAVNHRFCELLTSHYVSSLLAASKDTEVPALHYACKNGNLPLLHLLLRHGARVDERASYIEPDDEDRRPMMRPGIGIMRPGFGPTALHSCSWRNDASTAVEVARVLLEAGASVNARAPISGERPLHSAVIGNQSKELVALLLERGADVNATDNTGQTALHHCVSCKYHHLDNQLELARVLLRAGADIEAQVKCDRGHGVTPLELAIRGPAMWYFYEYDCPRLAADEVPRPRADMVKLLLECGADAEAKVCVAPPLLWQCISVYPTMHTFVIVKELLDAGAAVDAGCCETPLQECAGHLHCDLELVLAEAAELGPNLHALPEPEEDGKIWSWIVLEHMYRRALLATAMLLVERGAKVEAE